MNFSHSLNKETYIFIFMLILVPLAGQLYFHPFNDSFRVSFGTPTFFFSLLLLRKIPAIMSGFVVGILVVLFRIMIDLVLHTAAFTDSFQAHYPTFFYYVTFACLFYLMRMNLLHHRPLLMGFLGIIIEISSSVAEITFQYIAFGANLTPSGLHKVAVIAIFRSYFTIGFFNFLKLYTAKIKVEQTEQQNAHLLMIVSNLYEESIHLNKTLKNSEKITKDSYMLFQTLKESKSKEGSLSINDLQVKALKIAGEVHEVKKDNQRIFAGLSKLISDESFVEYMNVDELMTIIMQTNKNYAVSLKKDIKFVLDIKGCHPHYHVYNVLSIVNNLVMNAIEAIERKGTVTICVYHLHNWVEFTISDNGPGIPQKRRQLVFEPGFTSKYDSIGRSSTGIGLSYVHQIVEELKGQVILKSKPEVNGSTFTVRLPVHNLVKKG